MSRLGATFLEFVVFKLISLAADRADKVRIAHIGSDYRAGDRSVRLRKLLACI